MKKERKKIKDTKLGVWLGDKAPEIAHTVADLLPEQGVLGFIGNLLESAGLSAEEKAEARKLMLEAEISEQQELTKRWQADMAGNSWLACNIRPLTVAASLIFLFVMAVLDSTQALEVKEGWLDVLSVVATTALGGYFVLRTADKYGNRWK